MAKYTKNKNRNRNKKLLRNPLRKLKTKKKGGAEAKPLYDFASPNLTKDEAERQAKPLRQ